MLQEKSDSLPVNNEDGNDPVTVFSINPVTGLEWMNSDLDDHCSAFASWLVEHYGKVS
jgi:hypothetical protein